HTAVGRIGNPSSEPGRIANPSYNPVSHPSANRSIRDDPCPAPCPAFGKVAWWTLRLRGRLRQRFAKGFLGHHAATLELGANQEQIVLIHRIGQAVRAEQKNRLRSSMLEAPALLVGRHGEPHGFQKAL